MFPPAVPARRSERGATLIELMIALVVLALGILAVVRLFPAGARSQLGDQMLTSGNYYAQEKIEVLNHMLFSDPQLTDGRHPPGTATEACGTSGKWHRYYEVTSLAAPLDNLKRVTVTVTWTFMGARQTQSTTYLRR
jgi:prepilin-type N-terminal cleavage/methylation domain-containing protein